MSKGKYNLSETNQNATEVETEWLTTGFLWGV